MASIAPHNRDKHPKATKFADRALLNAVFLTGLASAVLLLLLLENPQFAAGFATLFLSAFGVTLIAANRKPNRVATAKGPDRALIRATLEGAGIPIAVTDRQGILLVANSLFERDFRDAPTPPALPFAEDGVERLMHAGRSAWRDGRGHA